MAKDAAIQTLATQTGVRSGGMGGGDNLPQKTNPSTVHRVIPIETKIINRRKIQRHPDQYLGFITPAQPEQSTSLKDDLESVDLAQSISSAEAG